MSVPKIRYAGTRGPPRTGTSGGAGCRGGVGLGNRVRGGDQRGRARRGAMSVTNSRISSWMARIRHLAPALAPTCGPPSLGTAPPPHPQLVARTLPEWGAGAREGWEGVGTGPTGPGGDPPTTTEPTPPSPVQWPGPCRNGVWGAQVGREGIPINPPPTHPTHPSDQWPGPYRKGWWWGWGGVCGTDAVSRTATLVTNTCMRVGDEGVGAWFETPLPTPTHRIPPLTLFCLAG